jgi:hypothetical protein
MQDRTNIYCGGKLKDRFENPPEQEEDTEGERYQHNPH